MPAPTDPFQTHLDRAASLFESGDVVQAGQIWQAILKRDPGHAAARAGLYRVKQFFDQKDLTAANEVLLQEGCTLFDMGQTREAMEKWERILATDPRHKLALAYANDARRELGLPPLGAPPASAEAVPEPPPPPPAPAMESESPLETAERLVMEGVQIYDMGMSEEAMAKWERALDLNPQHKDAAAYLAMARREQAQAPAGPPAGPLAGPAAPTAAAAADAQRETQIWRAEQWLREGRLADAAKGFEDLMRQDPQNPRILQGYHQARALVAAQAPPSVPSLPSPVPAPAPAAMPAPVGPPRALTVRSPSQRDGLRLPGAFKGAALPEWLRVPRNLALVLGVVLLVFLGLLGYGLHRREQALKEAVANAKLAALKPVSRMTQVPSLAENSEAIQREGEQAMGEDPLLAYFRAQELQRRSPDDPGPAQMMQKARDKMAGIPPAGDLVEFERNLQAGNLDTARKCIVGLLCRDPDDLDLRGRARKVILALAPLYAGEGRLGQAREVLLLGRAMFPQDPGWQARLKLLGAIQAMPESERASWVQLLG